MSSAISKRPGISPAALLSVQVGASPHTQAAYARSIRAFLAWAGDRALSAALLAEWIDSLRQAGAGSSLLRQRLFCTKAAILQAAVNAGMAGHELAALKTAMDSIKAMKVPRPEIRVVTPEERQTLLAAMSPRMRLIARFLYATAARISEALAVREADIVLETETARVRLHGKGGRERVVRIPLDLLREINGHWPAGRTLLFQTSRGRKMPRQIVTEALAKAARETLHRPVSPHDLRHSRATDLYEKSGNLKGVSELLGHSDVAVTARYYVRTTLTKDDLWKDERI